MIFPLKPLSYVFSLPIGVLTFRISRAHILSNKRPVMSGSLPELQLAFAHILPANAPQYMRCVCVPDGGPAGRSVQLSHCQRFELVCQSSLQPPDSGSV